MIPILLLELDDSCVRPLQLGKLSFKNAILHHVLPYIRKEHVENISCIPLLDVINSVQQCVWGAGK